MHLLTTDIYEGAYLLSHGMQLEKLWQNGPSTSLRTGRRTVVFEFTGPQLELLRKDYQKGRASANVTKLKQSLTELKDRMFDLLRTVETPNDKPTGQAERRENHEYKSAIQV